MNSRLGVIIVAAGSSSRMGGVDKVFAGLLGRPVLAWSIEAFGRMPEVTAAVLVLSTTNLERGRALVQEMGFGRVAACVPGGARRQDSVRAGLEALAGAGPDFDFIAIHDGARPFVDEAMVRRGLAAVLATGAAIAAVPVKDTIKSAGPDRIVTGTPDRRALWAVQTPQVFKAKVILDAHRRVSQEVTDDASMVELTGGRVSVFDGHPENMKITTPDDLLLAGLIATRRAGEPGSVAGDGTSLLAPALTFSGTGGAVQQGVRFGTGFDGHRLAPPGPLRLGGVDISFDMRLAGHSDGDVLLHAVASAFLGAAGLGDLGRHFPSTDPSLRGIDSRVLLSRSLDLVRGRGWSPEYVDATIIAQRPKLAPYLDQMAAAIAEAVGLAPGHVNVKVTSTDGVGAIGEGQGIAAQAVASIRRTGVSADSP
jgi:2-C-methyl-D-erythritol 4-phosphate cytidylyltransferase/2-C-methyl-D-erythritol 2,4-cyclodiphosphate synthase